MEKVLIGRAFTPFQHHNLIQQLEDFIEENTELLVLPNIDHFYLHGQIKEWEAEQLFKETWQKIIEIKEKHGFKVLTSLHQSDSSIGRKVLEDSDHRIKVENTQQGLKYESNDFKQYSYSDGGQVQTTVPYWYRKTCEKVELSAKVV
jgi:hypothetical protein